MENKAFTFFRKYKCLLLVTVLGCFLLYQNPFFRKLIFKISPPRIREVSFENFKFKCPPEWTIIASSPHVRTFSVFDFSPMFYGYTGPKKIFTVIVKKKDRDFSDLKRVVEKNLFKGEKGYCIDYSFLNYRILEFANVKTRPLSHRTYFYVDIGENYRMFLVYSGSVKDKYINLGKILKSIK